MYTPADHHPPIIDRRDLDSLSFPIGDDYSRFLDHLYIAAFREKFLLVRWTRTPATTVLQTCAVFKGASVTVVYSIAGNG